MSNKTRSNSTRAERLRQEQERAAREKRVRTIVMISVVGVVALALVGVIVWVVVGANRQQPAASAPLAEMGAVQGDTLVLGKQDAPVTLEIYQDYMCPYCGRFERANRADVEQLVEDGTVRLVIHPLAFLDAQSAGGRYSSRAANAAVTVAQYQPDKLLAFNAALYDQQPAEGSQGLTDDQIAELARTVGVDAATIDRFSAESNVVPVQSLTEAAFDSGIKGTPTVKINGEPFNADMYMAGPLKTAVLAAAQDS